MNMGVGEAWGATSASCDQTWARDLEGLELVNGDLGGPADSARSLGFSVGLRMLNQSF